MSHTGIMVKAYQSWDGEKRNLNLTGMLAGLKAPKNLIIILHWIHAVARNLSGVTLARKQRGQTQDAYEKKKNASWSTVPTRAWW